MYEKQKVVSVWIIAIFVCSSLLGIFTTFGSENVVAELPGEHELDAGTVGLWHFNEGDDYVEV